MAQRVRPRRPVSARELACRAAYTAEAVAEAYARMEPAGRAQGQAPPLGAVVSLSARMAGAEARG